jgi:DNA-binding IclR family transcriptional regulator
MRRERESKSAPVGVVTKVLQILEVLHASPSGVPLKDIAEVTAINKSTAYRVLAHLEREGYVFRDSSGMYAIGVRLTRLGLGGSFQATMRKIGRPVLEELARLTGETVSLAVLEGREVFYVDVMESTHTFRLVSQIGMRHPLYCTALGKVILAFHSQEEQDNLISGIEFKRLTSHTITSAATLRKDLTLIRQRGYSLENEEVYLGSRCIGAPIFDESDRVVAALSVSGPITRVTREKVPIFAAAARQGAAAVSKGLAGG